ncbi:MAG: radical SAM family heme chaperone HemW [Acidobacteriota bacterium]
MNQTAGIYIHIPFCERKCTYCNFNTTDFFADLAARYIEAVNQEINYWGAKLSAEKSRLEATHEFTGDKLAVDTIFFGGGTPSIVEAEQLASIIDSARQAFAVASDAEITIEINPATFTRQKIAGWLRGGINRASVGVQSFIDTELAGLSRTHNTAQVRQTVEALRQAGFNNLSLDLIAGLPAQSKQDWAFNLLEALKLRPEHLSLYLLEVKESTQLYAQIKRGLVPQPDEDLAGEMYEMISEATQQAGYEHYEISNFALISDLPKSYRAKHNVKYWTGAPFYGIGCGAHSYDGRARWVNRLKTESYIEAIVARGHAINDRRELSHEERAADAIFMGLRLAEGINLESFQKDYGVDILERYADELPRLLDAELLRIENRCLMLTARGRLLSNEVFMTFV